MKIKLLLALVLMGGAAYGQGVQPSYPPGATMTSME